LTPEKITFVGISHYHGDHVGQVASFSRRGRLLVGKGDWEVLNDPKPNPNVNVANFAHWIGGGGKVERWPVTKTFSATAASSCYRRPGTRRATTVCWSNSGQGQCAHYRRPGAFP